MAIANYFYNESIRKYVALFGTYFNQLQIKRLDNQGDEVQAMIVPITYAPYQKILARVKQDPKLNQKSSVTLPRMSFEMTSMSYDSARKVSSVQKMRKRSVNEDTGNHGFIHAGTPYNLEFSLYIMTKYNEDGTKLLEQILPFFTPEFTSTVRLIDDMDPVDIPLILNSVSSEDIYEDAFITRRSIMWTLNFTMKAWFYGPQKQGKSIKFVDLRFATTDAADSAIEKTLTIQPGLTANNEPTTNIEETVDYSLINFDDDWDYIIQTDNP
jgi:hypothetical protein